MGKLTGRPCCIRLVHPCCLARLKIVLFGTYLYRFGGGNDVNMGRKYIKKHISSYRLERERKVMSTGVCCVGSCFIFNCNIIIYNDDDDKSI